MADVMKVVKGLEDELEIARMQADLNPSGKGNDASYQAWKKLVEKLDELIKDKKTPENVRVALRAKFDQHMEKK
jgi:hypothetical protein